MAKRGLGNPIKIGERAGKLLVVGGGGYASDDINKLWVVRCDCGAELTLLSNAVRKRIGCDTCSRKSGADRRKTHGDSDKPLYRAWQAMHRRCNNPKIRSYRWYGARGISVCEEWADYTIFRAWAVANGYQIGLTLERKDEMLGYRPTNCEYLTKSENSKRMRAKYHFVKCVPVVDRCFPADAVYGYG